MRGTGYNIRTKTGTVKARSLRTSSGVSSKRRSRTRSSCFGSAARGEMGPNSDLDLLVIKGGKFNRGRVTTAIYRHLAGADAAVDVVLVTPEEVERLSAIRSIAATLVIYSAIERGKGRLWGINAIRPDDPANGSTEPGAISSFHE